MHIYVKCSSSHAQNTHQPCRQLMKLRIMTISIKLKVLINQICVEKSQKAMKCVLFALIVVCICEMLFLACTEHTSTRSPVDEIQDYDY